MEHHRGVAATLSGHLEVISKVAFEFGAERTATDIGQPRLPGMSYRGNGIHKVGAGRFGGLRSAEARRSKPRCRSSKAHARRQSRARHRRRPSSAWVRGNHPFCSLRARGAVHEQQDCWSGRYRTRASKSPGSVTLSSGAGEVPLLVKQRNPVISQNDCYVRLPF